MFLPLILLPTIVCGQESANQDIYPLPFELKFDRFTQEDGLPTAPVTSILQDEKGFLWLGTWNGLYKYDGYQFHGYWHDPQDANSLSQDRVQVMMIDRKGRFWVGTNEGGLNLFDSDKGTFRHFRHNPDDPSSLSHDEITVMLEDRSGTLWIGTQNGLNIFDPETGRFRHFPSDTADPHSLYGQEIRALYEDSQGVLWIGTGNPFTSKFSGALNRFNPRDQTFARYFVQPDDPTSPINFVQTIFESADKKLWIGTWDGGLFLFDSQTEAFSKLEFADSILLKSEAGRLPGITTIYRHPQTNIIWIGTYRAGLIRYDEAKNLATHFAYHARDPFSLNDNRIWFLLVDRQGSLWIGSHGGLNRTNSEGKLPRFALAENGVSKNEEWVTGLHEDPENHIWIATSDMRFIEWDRYSGGTVSHKPSSHPCNSWDFSGAAITGDHNGGLWSVTSCGLYHYDPITKSFTRFGTEVVQPARLHADQPPQIVVDDSGNVWITSDDGVVQARRMEGDFQIYRYDPANTHSLSDNDVDSVFRDKKGNIWIGTQRGLNRFDPKTSGFDRFLQPSESSRLVAITDIREDDSGNFWLTTDSMGALLWDPETETYDQFNLKNGLHTNTLMNVLPSPEKILWLFSPTGVTRFDPHTGAFQFLSDTDGLVEVQFSRRAVYRSSQGDFLVGGRGGLNVFTPNQYGDGKELPAPLLTGLRISGKLIRPGQNSPLARPISEVADITMGSSQTNLTFDYVGLFYRNPRLVQYRYQLQNYDQDWVTAGTQRSARYTNLKPGDYVFRVNAGIGNRWNENVASVRIQILPPWWRTSWAFALYALLFLSVVIAADRVQRRRLIRREQERARERDLKQAQELRKAYEALDKAHHELKITKARVDEMKSRFFANISHEFRTPLTLILGQIDSLMGRLSGKDQERLQMAAKNGKRLQRLINQLLDLSKFEAGSMELHGTPMNIVPFLKNLFFSFESLMQQKGIHGHFQTSFDQVVVEFEEDKLEKAFINLLSNAVKFTEFGGSVQMIITVTSDPPEVVKIVLKDTGIGIPEESLPYIFDRFYQVGSQRKNPYEGTGIGLALTKEILDLHHGTITVTSTEGSGTTFIVTLPSTHVSERSFLAPDVTTASESSRDTSFEAGQKFELSQQEKARNSEERPISMIENEKREMILVIEDNLDVRWYLKDHLEGSYRVLEAGDGFEGFDRASALIPDLIISDVMMPKMDGYELARKLREDERTSHIPIVILTARAAQEDRIVGLETGVDDYLVKPFSPKELQVRVRNLIALRKKLRERFSTATIIKPSDVSSVSLDQTFLKRVLETIERRMGDDQFNVDRLADDIHLSVSQLNRKLKALIDQSSGQLIRSMRLQRAADLLIQKAGNIADICYEVGFPDQANFTRSFKKQFGLSPTQDQKEQETKEPT